MVKVLTSLLALVSFEHYFNWFGVKFGMISNMELTERTLSEGRLYIGLPMYKIIEISKLVF